MKEGRYSKIGNTGTRGTCSIVGWRSLAVKDSGKERTGIINWIKGKFDDNKDRTATRVGGIRIIILWMVIGNCKYQTIKWMYLMQIR